MTPFAELLQQGAANAWFFVPTAILLGALHGLEPGHSKTMMAAFIVAIRGTMAQAVLLGLAATVSHTAIVWIIALGGLYLWRDIAPESFEPWLQLLSGILIVAMAAWMMWQVREDRRRAQLAAGGFHHDHHHGHGDHGPRGHHHGDVRRIDTRHGTVSLEVFEDGVPPRWRLRTLAGRPWRAEDVAVTTERPGGKMQRFAFVARDRYLESVDEIPEPHQFVARVSLGHGGHTHDYDLAFTEHHGHGHGHTHPHPHGEARGLALAADGHQDAHQLAHANDIQRRFADRRATNWQILIFGLTGGLIQCPAAITVLLLCLQLKEVTLGAALVLCFSIGLAVTLVAVGAVAAWSVAHATKRSAWFSTAAQRAPYFSGALVAAVGIYVGILGWIGINA
jgi:nickel/cobalt exporter